MLLGQKNNLTSQIQLLRISNQPGWFFHLVCFFISSYLYVCNYQLFLIL